MVLLLPLALILAAPGTAEPLSDRIDREYVQPVFQQLQGALDGREPNWAPPVLPGSAQTAKLSERIRTLWLDPLMSADQDYAFAAASSLASPQTFEPPPEPDLTSILSDASISPATEDLVSMIERRFFSRLLPEGDALGASDALQPGGGAAPPRAAARFAHQDDFFAKRKFADSTRLTRGSAGASTARSKLKAFRSQFSSAP
jgi:hypothetical protein